MPKTNNWLKCGNVNPREHGGLFIRYDPKLQEYEIVQTTSIKDYENFVYSYLFEIAIVESYMVQKDKGLQDFAGVVVEDTESLTDDVIITILTSYIPYYGSDNGGYEVSNYWGELKTYGIYPITSKK